MSNRFDFGGVNMRASDGSSVAQPTSETPFCIAVLGDFSGRVSRGIVDAKNIGERRTHLVDRDNFEEVFSRLHVELHLSSANGAPLVFRFSELEDFHPDRLFEQEAFQQFRRLRDQLRDPATFSKVAEELGLLRPQPAIAGPQVESSRVVAPTAVQLASGSLLDDMIEQTESRISHESRRTSDPVRAFAREIAAKYSVSTPDPRQPELVAAVDRAVAGAMSAILHHPDFQALEAIWRTLFLLVRALDTGPRLKLYLVDISQEELAADLSPSSDLRDTGIYRLIVEKGIQTPGADPWSVIVGNFRFGADSKDLQILAQASRVAHAAGAVFLGEASPSLVGCSSLASTPHPREWNRSADLKSWAQVRRMPEAASLGLALPRFLLRLPYGKETSALESFDYEEFSGPPAHEDYLWGNPAFVIALLLGQSFAESGWQLQPGAFAQVENLPLHIYIDASNSESKPCAEALLTEEAVERILDQGLIPLISYKGRDSVRVGRFQSVADPQRPLAGRWNA